VGGVMEPDLFSFTHSGETKHIVVEFIQEVALTLKWVTSIAKNAKVQKNDEDQQQQQQEEWINFETKFQHEVKVEKEKVSYNQKETVFYLQRERVTALLKKTVVF
jgi:hypothetical protein